MHPIADAAGTLGSRFNLIFDPHGSALYHNAYGEFREQPLYLTVGIRTPDGELWSLPFTTDASHFPYLEHVSSLTTIEYRGVQPALWIEFAMKIRAPFYPQDAKLSTAPFFYVDLEVKRLDRFRWDRCEHPLQGGEIVFVLRGDGVSFESADSTLSYSFPSKSTVRAGNPDNPDGGRSQTYTVRSCVRAGEGAKSAAGGFKKEFDLSADGAASLGLLWSSWAEEPVMEVSGEDAPFKYHEFFGSEQKMLDWAEGEREEIERRCDFLDRTVQDWSLGASASNLAALALHSFLVNTWWVTRKDGREWFSVWEGSCYYHSTVDVEYNDALLYFALWPELLDMLLDEWPDFEQDGTRSLGPDGKKTSYLAHDMGSHFFAGRQCYHHAMEVEENANYLLLLAAGAAFAGNLKRAKKALPLCRRLAEFIVKSDTTGNGLPDKGTANTIDDASPAVQFGREQIYLTVKAQAALWALAELEELCDPKKSHAERWRAFVAKGIKTLEEEAWLDDHYAVTLTRTAEGVTDAWTGEELGAGELKGWDDYSIYTANGLLYLFLGNLKMPRWRRERLAMDLESAERRCRTRYGCTHTAGGDWIVWFSQNMWRDYVAAYLGIDMLNNVERYWDYQVLTGDNLHSALYYDSTPGNNLNFYPRGAVVFGAPLCAAGMRLNRLQGALHLCPVRTTLDVPLLPLADWKGMRIPWLSVRQREGLATARISHGELLEGLKVHITGAELETA